MRLRLKIAVALGIISCYSSPIVTTLAQIPSTPKPFMVFDATFYSHKPDLKSYGLRPITLAYAGSFGPDWNQSPDRLPDLQAVQAVARNAQQDGHPVVLDIEHWPLEGTSSLVQSSLSKYLQVLIWFRETAPNLPLGYYGAPPIRDYWRSTKDIASAERASWMMANDQTRSLGKAVDALYPSLYTFYPDQVGWKAYAIAQIEEARRLGEGKPIYVFLWPQYHESNSTLGGSYLPADYWRLELETARQYADGIVIWGGLGSDNRPANWDENAAWWKVTKGFMESADFKPPAAPTALTIR